VVIILRKKTLYGNGGLIQWAKNELILGNRINGFSNCIFNPVSTEQLSALIYKSINNLSGMINVGSKTIISKYDFLKVVALQLNLDVNLIFPVETKMFLALTTPSNSEYCNFNLMEGIISLKLKK